MPCIRLDGAHIAALTEQATVDEILDATTARRGHWTITANLDHLRRCRQDPVARQLLSAADLVVADGMPLVWASKLAGTSLPERVAGSNMIWTICEHACRRGQSIFLLGGDPGVAQRAADVLGERYAGLEVAGTICPPRGFERDESEVERLVDEVVAAAPRIVFVALGFPKQDLLIRRLRSSLPGSSFVGVGISLSFVAGEVSRAPGWVRRLGFEWLYRLVQEPQRLARRYLVDGIPFLLRLLFAAVWYRFRRDRRGRWGWASAKARSDTKAQLTVHHFGPDPSHVGGMSSVIRVLADHRVGADAVQVHPTWRPDARLQTSRLTVRAALKILRLPSRDVAHIHLSEKGSFIREGALVALARKRGVTTVVTIHGACFISFARQRPGLVGWVLRRAHAITCLDDEARELASSLARVVPTRMLPNPVAIDRDACSAVDTDELVLFAGEIGLRKGADVLVDAWRQVAAVRERAHCIMVGPIGDLILPELERLEIRASVGPREMRELLRAARVVALPSRAEGMPMILTEAMSGARPFVSTPVGGISDLAREGGMLVAVDDHSALAARLTRLLEDPELAARIGERGRIFCSKTRSVEVMNLRLRQLYVNAGRAAPARTVPRPSVQRHRTRRPNRG
jgi:exopolysaccharide biosynthesis WecB/TagA/CpsF family protein